MPHEAAQGSVQALRVKRSKVPIFFALAGELALDSGCADL